MKPITKAQMATVLLFSVLLILFFIFKKSGWIRVVPACELQQAELKEKLHAEARHRMWAEIVDANSASYNPTTQVFEVWFNGTRDATIYAKTIVPTDSISFRTTHDSIFDYNLIVLKDTNEKWIFGGFIEK